MKKKITIVGLYISFNYYVTTITVLVSLRTMIMDEVDQLDSKNQDVLYTMFEWPHLNNSRLVLIGTSRAGSSHATACVVLHTKC